MVTPDYSLAVPNLVLMVILINSNIHYYTSHTCSPLPLLLSKHTLISFCFGSS
ncbi:hypothetical protein PILCRDRAFT_7720 [Piloderma croceum F 1598]|uniref:Uncharacterized protein n=1 Tax=Piloderma croceum (strain F 1598) TaxID=765440 RepID=A0A0C3FW84_PILCF|nr:hypothetical protein PILCRDRAFT_7720 [Piloderma croceum F 1598]